MHKCASTTLQNNVFKFEPGAVGTHMKMKPDINFGKQFQHLAPVGGRQLGSISGVSDWVERVRKHYSGSHPELNRFIVSSEFLCQANKLSNRPIIKFLDDINQSLFDGNSIKVIIVFRNQSEMMASMYAQNSGTQYNSSQKDFEKWVEGRLKETNKSKLDWGQWAKDLVETFGRENVCILLLEEMNKKVFWENLVSFIDAREITAEKMHKNNSSSKKNRRKIDKKTWGLRPFDLEKKAKVDIHIIKQFMSGICLHGVLMDKIVDNLIQMRIKHLKLRGYQDKQVIDPEIRLNYEIKSKIRDSFKDSNSMLSKILERDISHLGY